MYLTLSPVSYIQNFDTQLCFCIQHLEPKILVINKFLGNQISWNILNSEFLIFDIFYRLQPDYNNEDWKILKAFGTIKINLIEKWYTKF